MLSSYCRKIQWFSPSLVLKLIFMLGFFSPKSWAAVNAIVVSEKAIIYSDKEMTSPLGYVKRGKKIVIGEIPRNLAQVYPVVVSGKIAYIKVEDVSTERESMYSERLVAERFQKNTHDIFETKYNLSFFTYNSSIHLAEKNTAIDSTAYQWNGLSLKGEVLLQKKYDVQVIANYLYTTRKAFSVFEVGGGVGYRLVDKRKHLFRAEGQLLAIPFSSFSYKSDFRIKSYGYTLGAGLNYLYRFDGNWGLETFAGIYRMSLLGFDLPSPYSNISPVFLGTRFGIGATYSY